MPHCIIEYSRNLEVKITPAKMIETVFQGAVSANLFDSNNIKVRTVAFDNYRVGNSEIDFIHTTLRILSGRSRTQRNQLSFSILKALESLKLSDVSLTVEIVDMEKESYAKSIA